jgi:hypothetical protein
MPGHCDSAIWRNATDIMTKVLACKEPKVLTGQPCRNQQHKVHKHLGPHVLLEPNHSPLLLQSPPACNVQIQVLDAGINIL